ncbi:MAG: NRDE family protein [Pseudohongiellaceae bacterium]
MCLILFAYKIIPEFPLVVAANRDELFARPTRQAQLWHADESSTEILSGKDLQAGGTWLGLSDDGRFAAVTNIRDPSQVEKKPKSRGELTLNFLANKKSAEKYSNELSSQFSDFAGYNLLVGDAESLWYVNNFENIVERLQPGVYGLSNGVLDSHWPKINNGKQALSNLLEKPHDLTTDALIEIMTNRSMAADDALPNTGVPIHLERILSSMFIANPERQYGTLCSTAIITESTGRYRFSEQNYRDDGSPAQRHFFDSNFIDV